MKMIRRYLTIYFSLFLFTLKSMLEYRLNFVLQLLYGPAYTLVLFLILATAYSKTEMLGGFTRQEGMLLFFVFQSLYMTFYFFCMKGLRHLIWTGIRMGEFDFILTKPINPQFFASMHKPYIEQLPLALFLLGMLVKTLWELPITIGFSQVALFGLTYLMGMAIAYFMVSGYCTAGFYATKAAQVIELLDKAADTAQYPNTIYPETIRLATFTVIPIAFFSYVPTLFILGKGSTSLLILSFTALVISFFINQWLWKRGLEHYSSASS